MAVRHPIVNNSKRQARDRTSESLRSRRTRSLTIALYLALPAITVAVFGQAARHQFVNFDDDLYVYDSPVIKAGLTINGILLAFTSPHARNRHPLTTISHMLDCQLWGLEAGGHHLTHLLSHPIPVLLIFAVLRQMTGALWKSALVAALFAIHPLHVESVAWVSERKDVLSAVFFVLMLSAYVRYTRTHSIVHYLVVVVLFVAGLMSKPMIVTVPFILLLVDYSPLDRFSRERTRLAHGDRSPHRAHSVAFLLVEKIPLFALSALSCIATSLV